MRLKKVFIFDQKVLFKVSTKFWSFFMNNCKENVTYYECRSAKFILDFSLPETFHDPFQD